MALGIGQLQVIAALAVLLTNLTRPRDDKTKFQAARPTWGAFCSPQLGTAAYAAELLASPNPLPGGPFRWQMETGYRWPWLASASWQRPSRIPIRRCAMLATRKAKRGRRPCQLSQGCEEKHPHSQNWCASRGSQLSILFSTTCMPRAICCLAARARAEEA